MSEREGAVADAGRASYDSLPHTVCICICTRGRPRELARTLASLAQSTHPIARVVVSDDAQDDEARIVCARAALPIEYVRGPGRGLGPNRNHALQSAHEDFVLFLDDDCLLDATFLERALACAERAEAELGRGRVAVSGGELNQGRLVLAGAQTFLGFQAQPYADGEPLTSIVINATLLPLALFDRLRFDSQLVYGYDEVDLASRAVRAGFAIVPCPEAVNDHRPSPRGREGYSAVLNASRLYVTFKRYAFTERRLGRAAAYALVAPVHVLAAGVKHDGLAGGRAGLAAVLSALRYLVRERRS